LNESIARTHASIITSAAAAATRCHPPTLSHHDNTARQRQTELNCYTFAVADGGSLCQSLNAASSMQHFTGNESKRFKTRLWFRKSLLDRGVELWTQSIFWYNKNARSFGFPRPLF
jgi:hypothetical protein